MPHIASASPLNKFHLSLLTSSLLLAATPSFAEAAAEDARLDTVTVISTGLRGQQRTVANSPAPIDVNGNVVPAVTRLTPSGSNLAKALGGDDLKPEKSRNLGLTWQPAPRTSITADVYLIDIDDRIALTSNIYDRGNGAINAILAAQGVPTGTWVNTTPTPSIPAPATRRVRWQVPA